MLSVPKSQILHSRFAATQFVYQLDPRTLLPIELAAPAIGKSPTTFRSDLVRRPEALPSVTRRGGRVFVSVADVLDWLEHGPRQPEPEQVPRTGKKRGRPTKAEQLARARQAQA
jgi:hypothetical protein